MIQFYPKYKIHSSIIETLYAKKLVHNPPIKNVTAFLGYKREHGNNEGKSIGFSDSHGRLSEA